MLPRIVEIAGYWVICGRACLTLARLSTNVLTPGSILFICWSNPDASATDVLVGRSPVCSDQVLTWAGAVSQSRNCSAALTWLLPLLNTTQLSGPEMVWWPALLPG